MNLFFCADGVLANLNLFLTFVLFSLKNMIFFQENSGKLSFVNKFYEISRSLII